MRAVSSTYKSIIASGETRNFTLRIEMTLADGTKFDDLDEPAITEEDIMERSFQVLTSSSGQNTFDIGTAIIGKCVFTLNNLDDRYTEYDFFDAEATVWIGLVGDTNEGTQIYHRLGFFTVDEPQMAGSLITLELLDNMWKFDRDLPTIPYPRSIGDIVSRLCTHCGVILATQTFNGSDYVIQSQPDGDMNCRELLQYVAMIGCNFCVMNDQGALAIKWYDTAAYNDHTIPRISTFDHLFTRNVGTDELTITGVKIKINENEYLIGMEGYVLTLENPLITEDNVSAILNIIWNRLNGFVLRTFNVTTLPDIAPEVGDCVAVNYKGDLVYSYLTNNTFTPSLLTSSLGAVTPTRALSQRYSKTVQAAVEIARQKVDQQIGIYDLTAQRMNQLAINAMGGYTDFDDLTTGGRVYYLSNAPITKDAQTGLCVFPDSAVVYKTTGDGFFVSVSGGVDPVTHERIWTQGYTPSTGLLVELLTALKINAEQIFTGKLEVGGSQTGVAKPYIRVLDGLDNVICTIDYRGIIMNSGYIASSNYAEQTPEGTFSLIGMKIDVNGSYVKSPHFAFNNSGAYIDGEVIANSGRIGAATITQDAIKIIGDVELYNGSSSFTFKPADYYFLEDFKLLFKTSSGTSTVTLVRHQNGTDTTIGTYTATTEGVESATIDRTLGGDNYYRITVTASTEVIAHDVVIAYMGMEGFRGVLQGIFKGYLESNSGIINGFRYNGSNEFYGNFMGIVSPNGMNNHEARIDLPVSGNYEPTIYRTYHNGNTEVVEEVAWGTKQNLIAHEILPPSSNPGTEGDLMIAPASQGNADSFYRYENGAWTEIDLGDGGGGGGGGGLNYITTEQDTGLTYNGNPNLHVMQLTFIKPVSSAGQQNIEIVSGLSGPILQVDCTLNMYMGQSQQIGLTLPLYGLSYVSKSWTAYITKFESTVYLQATLPSGIGSDYWNASFIGTIRYVKTIV